MTSAEPAIRRILVALEPSAHGRAALEAAARIAASLRAELIGLYVEDVELLRLAEFPFAREFSALMATGRSLSGAVMARALRTEARRAEEALVRAAERHRVPWTFGVRRGEVTSELVAAAIGADLVVLGRTRAPGTRAASVGSTVRGVVGRCTTTVLVVPGGARPGGAVAALYEDDVAGAAVVAMAAALARAEAGELVVLATAEALCPGAEAALLESGVPGRVVTVPPADLPAILADLARPGSPTLVLHRARHDPLLETAAYPVLIVG